MHGNFIAFNTQVVFPQSRCQVSIQRKTTELAHLTDSLRTLQARYDLYDIGAQGASLAGDLR